MVLVNPLGPLALEETSKKIQRGEPDQDVRFQFEAIGSENKLKYRGVAAPGTLPGAATWQIERYSWIAGPAGGNVPSMIQTRVGSWDNREGLGW